MVFIIFSINFESFTEQVFSSFLQLQFFELGNMKSLFLEEDFTTVILTSLTLLLLPSRIEEFVLL